MFRLASLLALALLLPSPAGAARAKKPKPAPPVAAPAAPAPAAAGQEPLAQMPLTELLERAGKHYRDLDYDKVLPLAEAVLARSEASIEQRLDAYLLQGSSLAIIGDAVEAEKPFRFLLRGRPDFDMAADTPPKILAIFRKVQVEEKAIVDQMRELERARILKDLKLMGDPPEKGQGGQPLPFEFRLRDPRGVVAQVELRYRRGGDQAFAALPLARSEGGAWAAAIPGEWTQSPEPYRLEYYLTTTDSEGRGLLDLASASSPHALPVEAGSVPTSTPLYKNGWFWGGVAAVVVALGAASVLIYTQGSELPKTDLGTLQPR